MMSLSRSQRNCRVVARIKGRAAAPKALALDASHDPAAQSAIEVKGRQAPANGSATFGQNGRVTFVYGRLANSAPTAPGEAM